MDWNLNELAAEARGSPETLNELKWNEICKVNVLVSTPKMLVFPYISET